MEETALDHGCGDLRRESESTLSKCAPSGRTSLQSTLEQLSAALEQRHWQVITAAIEAYAVTKLSEAVAIVRSPESTNGPELPFGPDSHIPAI